MQGPNGANIAHSSNHYSTSVPFREHSELASPAAGTCLYAAGSHQERLQTKMDLFVKSDFWVCGGTGGGIWR